jgi:hypothetical protein
MRLLLAFALLLIGASAAAQPVQPAPIAELVAKGPQAVLEAADLQHNNFADQELTVRMTIRGGTEDGRQLEFVTLTKGDKQRAMRFEAPADMKGMGVVIKGRDEIYVRLPDSPKVRRVAAHARKQSFQGTDFSFDDMAMIRLAPDFTAKSMKDTGEHYELALERNPGVDLPYPTLTVLVHKERVTLEKIIYHDENGKALKQQERTQYEKASDGHIVYKMIIMRDLTREHSTESAVLGERINLGVEEETFSKRWLVRSL